ncbi:MAG: hypothetical protein R2698_13770 [Microthrixaceae bacterium]
MAVEVTCSTNLVSISFRGLDRMLALCRTVDLHTDEITRAIVLPTSEARSTLGLRVGGAYWPSTIATGWFTIRGMRGQLQLWDVYRDEEVLVVETTRPKPARIVVQHPERHELADRIGAMASGHAGTAPLTR